MAEAKKLTAFRLHPDGLRRLDLLAYDYGLNRSVVLRVILAEAFRRPDVIAAARRRMEALAGEARDSTPAF